MINFDRKLFFPFKKSLLQEEILLELKDILLDHKFNNNLDPINDISSLDFIRNNSVLFINKNLKHQFINKILVITDNKSYLNEDNFLNVILVSNLNHSYKLISELLFNHDDSSYFFDEFIRVNNSLLSKYAFIDPSAEIQSNCIIGRGVKIGKNCIIKNNVTIKNSIIADNVTISEGSIIGSSGFGFDLKLMGARNLLPQLGIVYIDNNSYIGASCTIDRAKIDATIIGENTMLDNLIHIGHNVKIGKNVCIAAQTGISGSVTIGDRVVIGGQCGIAGHITIGDNVIVAGKSGVTKNLPNNSRVAGFPALDIKKWKKLVINARKI